MTIVEWGERIAKYREAHPDAKSMPITREEADQYASQLTHLIDPLMWMGFPLEVVGE